MIWHVNCVWFFEKSSWQSVWLNKPLFTDPWFFVVGKFNPQVYPNICKETKVLSCMLLEKHLMTKFFLIFEKQTTIYTKMMELWIFLYALKLVHQYQQFSVPQIEYTLGGTSKMGSHVYFLLMVAMVLLLWRHIVLLWRQDNISIKQ